jgi:hypothetical protein
MLGEDEVLVWEAADKRANEILRAAAQQVRYKWAWRKIRNARFHLLETHTKKVKYGYPSYQSFITNGDVMEMDRG